MLDYTEQLLLGIDIGTTGCKCTIYDLMAKPVASGYKEYTMCSNQPGWCEEDPNDWWNATFTNIKLALYNSRIDPGRIAAVGVSCTNSIIPVDKNCSPIYNAIMQLDQRAIQEVDWIKENVGEEKIFSITGNRIAPGTFALPTLKWFMKNKPEIIKNAHCFLVPSGFIVGKLTGEFTINTSRMATTAMADIRSRKWAYDLIEQIGFPVEKLPRAYDAYEIVGTITAEAAALTGLKAGTPVVAGAMDTVAAAVGAGGTNPGDSLLAIGTCARLCLTTDVPEFDDRFMNCPNALPAKWLNIAAVNGAGVSLRWFRDVLGGAAVETARANGKSGYAIMDEAAELSPAGARGLTYLPYLAGERSPIWDPNARGVFFGLNLGTNQGDLVRSILEGIAFAIKQNMDIWLNAGKEIENLTLGGGAANSRVWTQILANILERPIVRLKVNETETLGDAILAGMGMGIITSPVEVAKGVIDYTSIIEPDERYFEQYREQFELYKKLYRNLKENFDILAQLNRIGQHRNGCQ